jgi:cytosine permease
VFSTIDYRVIALLLTIIFSASAIYGFDGLARIASISIPIVLFISFFGLSKILSSNGFGFMTIFEIPPYSTMHFGSAISITVGSWIVGAIAAPDIMRYAFNKKDVRITMFITFFILNTLQISIGAAMGLVARTWNLPIVLNRLGFGLLGVVLLIFISWTTSDNNYYAAGLGLSNFMNRRDRILPTIICIVVGAVLSVIGIYKYFADFLHFLSIVFTPIGGIMIVDYLMVGRSGYNREDILSGFKWKPFLAFAIGVLGALLIETSLQFIYSMLISGIVYFLLHAVPKREIVVSEE